MHAVITEYTHEMRQINTSFFYLSEPHFPVFSFLANSKAGLQVTISHIHLVTKSLTPAVTAIAIEAPLTPMEFPVATGRVPTYLLHTHSI